MDLSARLQESVQYFNRTTECFEEKDSSFTPKEGMMTVAQQVAHVAHTIDWFFEGAFRPEGFDMDLESFGRKIDAVTSLQDARAWFERAVANAEKEIRERSPEEWAGTLPEGPVMGGLPRAAILSGITDHTAHHRGALTVYARLCGHVPAMPYM